MRYLKAIRNGALTAFALAALYATAENRPVVNVNTATESQYRMLPGVGPKLASELNDYTEIHGDHKDGATFKTPEDLLKVKGIGPAKLKAMRPYIVLTGPTTATRKIKLQRPDKASKLAPVAPAVHDRRCPPDTRC